MKFRNYFLLFMTLCSCYKETPIDTKASFDFSFVKDDRSVPVNVLIKNTSEFADGYEWSFEGADIDASTDQNPGTVGYSKAGTYKIKLKVNNIDGKEDVYEKEIVLYEGININYKAPVIKNNYPPVEVSLKNTTLGENLSYKWLFENANIPSSNEKKPANIVFREPGVHKISLTVLNGIETFTKETTIEVKPKIISGFDWDVPYFDDDYQAPVTLTMKNNSEFVLEYFWSFEGGNPATSIEKNPKVVFDSQGVHKIKLTVSNGKYSETVNKEVKVFKDNNIRTFKDFKFGVNFAHRNNLIGAFFSSEQRTVLKAEELNDENSSKVSIVFSGDIDTGYTYGKFVSPDEVQDHGFSDLSSSTKTTIINSQDRCSCGGINVNDFDTMKDDTLLRTLNFINNPPNSKLHFDDSVLPRIVLFQTSDGVKGAIKVKSFINKGDRSHIVCDIKIQKLAK